MPLTLLVGRRDAGLGKSGGAGMAHFPAIICLARRRTGVILAMRRDQQPYQPPELTQAA